MGNDPLYDMAVSDPLWWMTLAEEAEDLSTATYQNDVPRRDRKIAELQAAFARLLPKPRIVEVRVLCPCQQRDVPAQGCALCEGDGYRTIEVDRDTGRVRISCGVYDPSDWIQLNA